MIHGHMLTGKMLTGEMLTVSISPVSIRPHTRKIFAFVVKVGHVFQLDLLNFSTELCSPYGETESEELLKVTWKNSTMSPELQRQW